jgi:23S rRNA pseudouridine2605 synthase
MHLQAKAMAQARAQAQNQDERALVKYLVGAGLGSRRHCAALVLSGFVTVNGKVAESLTLQVTHRDQIEVDGRPVTARRTGHVYLVANKPDGHLSSVTDDRGRPTVMDLIPRALRVNGLVPAGRLDLHSTGLILLTDDGELVNRVTHPRYEVEKEYYVTLDGVLTPSGSSKLRNGLTIETGEARALAVRRLHEEKGYRYSITLNEGRKREVRLMFRAIGRQVTALQRVRIGNLSVDGIKDGDVREMTSGELAGLRRLVAMNAPEPSVAHKPTQPPPPRKQGPPTSGRRGSPGNPRRGAPAPGARRTDKRPRVS